MKRHLLIVDPQNDFCSPEGKLYITGADKDMYRLAGFIKKHKEALNSISVTLDMHHFLHISHPYFWQDKKGNSPKPFTIIRLEEVLGETPKWRPREERFREQAIHYIDQLRVTGRYNLCIWPVHCLIGTWGHCIYEPVIAAIHEFEKTFSPVYYFLKGSNLMTEHYGALKAEIPDPNDPSTQANEAILTHIIEADQVLVAGEALSHCVAHTVTDIVEHLGPEHAKKFVVLKDTTRNIIGFRRLGEIFVKKMESLGMTFKRTHEIDL